LGIGLEAHAQPLPVEQTPFQTSATAEILAQKEALAKVAEARRLMADGAFDDRFAIEGLLNDAIRKNAFGEEAFAELGKFLVWQVAEGVRPASDLYMALELGDHVRDLAPQRPLGEYLRCEVLAAMGRVEESQKGCLELEEKFSQHPDTQVFRVRYYAQTNPPVALAASQKAIAQGISLDSVSSFVDEAITRSTTPENQGKAFSNFARIYPDRWLWHKAGVSYLAARRFSEAKEAFQSAIELGNAIESRLQLAYLESTAFKNYAEARVQYETVMESLESRKGNSRTLMAGIRARMALVQLDAGNVSDAVLNASRVIAEEPTETALVQALYDVFRARKLGEKLIPALSIAANENPYFSFAHLILGDLASDRKDFEGAVRQYSKVVALSPDEDFPYAKRAHAQYSLKNFKAALADFDFALAIKPEDASHHYNRSCMLALLGRNDDALVSLRAAIALDPRLTALASSDSDFDGLRLTQQFQAQMTASGMVSGTGKTATAAKEIPESP
jgi:tetratricopeptide (TPR) repeat protein